MKSKFLLLILMLGIMRMVQAQTVVDIIVNSPDHNTLEAAVLAAGLEGTLSGDGPFTVFAPTDAAFDALPDGVLDALLEDIPALTDILTYHVVEGTALSSDLSDGQVIMTLNGADVTVTINSDGVFINDAQVTVADVIADNGVVHVIDAVLLPPSNTVLDVIVNSPDHNTLEAAVIAAGLDGTLSGDGSFTVFAPTDAAFDALPDGTLEALLEDPQGLLTQILLYHVAADELLSSDLGSGFEIFTLLQFQEFLSVTVNSDGIFINDAQVTVADIQTDNGIVHVIDAVLLPSAPSVMDIIANSADHSLLTAAINVAGLGSTLDNEGPFTVFAPTDAAFEALPDGVLDALLEDIPSLTDILTYHVVEGTALSSDLSDQQEIITLNGETVTVTINSEGVFINDAQVTVADIIADNGVVHVIDAVLLPPPNSTREIDNRLELTLIPNPVIDMLRIEISNSESFADNIEIVDLQGKSFINKVNFSLQDPIDVSQFPSGIYLLKVGNQKGVSVRKFVKQ